MRFRGKQANEWCLMCGRGWPSGTNGARTMPRHIWARGEGIFLENLVLKYFYEKRRWGQWPEKYLGAVSAFLTTQNTQILKFHRSDKTNKTFSCFAKLYLLLLLINEHNCSKDIWHISTKWKLLSYEASELWLCLEKAIPHDPRLSPNHHRNMYWERWDFGQVTLRSFCVKNHNTRMS